MKQAFTLTLLFLALITNAQKRNVINFAGIYYDYLLASQNDDDLVFANKFGYSAGYDRLLGNRVSVGVKYIKFFGTASKGTEYYGYFGSQSSSGYNSMNATFTERGQGFAYESKFYFDNNGDDGPDESYICLTYQRLNFTEKLSNVRFTDNNYNTVPGADLSNKYVINRLGARWGTAVSGALDAEFYIGLFYNFSHGKNALFESPSRLAYVSFNIGYVFGVPF